MTLFSPGDLTELREAVAEALAAAEPLELVAGGTKRSLGRPLQVPRILDLSRLSGIRDYQPAELVLTAAAATPLAEIEAALAPARQMLAFEPPDWRKLLGGDGEPTLGGALACNLSGPRRIKAGAARDHFLGFRAVSGRGEVFKSGGKVVKNVTGYDLSKLLAGSYGTLAALEEVTVKVLPRPEHTETVMLCGLDPSAASALISRALGGPHEVSGAAYLPAGATTLSTGLAAGPTDASGVAAFRLEGPAPSVAFRRERLLAELAADGERAVLADDASTAFWRAIRDVEPLAGHVDRAVWRVSVAPARGAALGQAIARSAEAAWFADWGGGLLWVAVALDNGRAGKEPAEDGGAGLIRAAIRGADGHGGGHATLIKAPAALRRAVPVFEPQPPALAALSARVKESFDPRHILNPGRIVEGS